MVLSFSIGMGVFGSFFDYLMFQSISTSHSDTDGLVCIILVAWLFISICWFPPHHCLFASVGNGVVIYCKMKKVIQAIVAEGLILPLILIRR